MTDAAIDKAWFARLGSRLLQWVDYFVGEHYRQSVDQFSKVRLLVAGILTFIVSVAASSPVYVLIPDLPSFAVVAYFVIAVPVLLLWLYLLRLLKAGRGYRVASHTVLASILAVLYAGISVTGGPFRTEVHPLLAVPAVVAFLLLGRRSGFVWSLIIIACFMAMVAYAVAGGEYINLPPEDARNMLRVFNWLYAFCMVAALVYVYETMSVRVTEQRDAEREKFRHIASVAVGSSVVNESADALAYSGEELLSSTTQQKVALEQLMATTEQLNASAEQNEQLAAEARKAIEETEQYLVVSQADILQLSSAMNEIKVSGEEIQAINNMIDDIAWQTNLLSLNAMIEAARSGQGNGGFKVVAEEVKKLAQRSAEAAENVNSLLDKNLLSVRQGVTLTETMQTRFDDISERIKSLSSAIQTVAGASYEQSTAIRQIVNGLADIDQVVEANKSLAGTASSAARALTDNANKLLEVAGELDMSASS